MLRPDLGAAIELGTNRERIGGSKEIYKSSDFSTPGKVFPNAGLDKLALHAVSRLFPQLGRVNQARDVTSGKTDLPQLAGGNLGIYNYPVTAESRLRKKMAIASDYSQSKSAVAKQNPQAVTDLFANDPDAAVYLAFRPHMQQTLGQLKKIDQAKEDDFVQFGSTRQKKGSNRGPRQGAGTRGSERGQGRSGRRCSAETRSRTARQRPEYAPRADTPAFDREPTSRTVSRADFHDE